MLLSFNIPGLAFALFFLGLSSSMIAHEQQHDTMALLSRGMPSRKLLGLVALEELLVFVPGCPLGILSGLLLALGMGNTVGFLAFTPRPPLPVSIGDLAYGILAIALAAPLAARVGAALAVVRRPPVTTDRERARPLHAPFWMRWGLDPLLLAPTLYLYRRLANAGSLAALAPEHGTDLYRNPELVLLPTLFIVTGALVGLRAFPLLMRAVGTPRRQLVSALALEQAIVLAFGTSLAVALGAATARLFVPFMRIAPQAAASTAATVPPATVPLPPLIPMVAVSETLALAGVFAVVMVVLQIALILRTLARSRFSALKVFS